MVLPVPERLPLQRTTLTGLSVHIACSHGTSVHGHAGDACDAGAGRRARSSSVVEVDVAEPRPVVSWTVGGVRDRARRGRGRRDGRVLGLARPVAAGRPARPSVAPPAFEHRFLAPHGGLHGEVLVPRSSGAGGRRSTSRRRRPGPATGPAGRCRGDGAVEAGSAGRRARRRSTGAGPSCAEPTDRRSASPPWRSDALNRALRRRSRTRWALVRGVLDAPEHEESGRSYTTLPACRPDRRPLAAEALPKLCDTPVRGCSHRLDRRC